MRILAHVDRLGPPVGGGIVTTVTTLHELARRGHTVQYVTNRPVAPGAVRGPIHAAPPAAIVHDLYAWADLVIPHMTATPRALEYARRMGVPIVYPVHDDGQLDDYGITPQDVLLVVFCSAGLKQRTRWTGRQLVVHPPVFVDEHRVEVTGDAITIASLSREKGGELFWKLARRLPTRRFIGVRGGWGEQLIPEDVPANVTIFEHQGTDLREIFRHTRVLLLPSQQLGEEPRYWTENWGRAAIEAAVSGIPTIASPTPGPLEALGDAGIFLDRKAPDAWARALRSLDDPATYRKRAERARRRAAELEQIVSAQLDELSTLIEELVAQPTVGSHAEVVVCGERMGE